MGFVNHTLWLKITFKNLAPEEKHVLKLANSNISYFDIFYHAKGWQRSSQGLAQGIKPEDRPTVMPHIDLENVDVSKPVFVKIFSPNYEISLPIRVYLFDDFAALTSFFESVMGGYFGIVAASFLLSLVLGRFLRDKIYFSYSFFILSLHILFIGTISGYSYN